MRLCADRLSGRRSQRHGDEAQCDQRGPCTEHGRGCYQAGREHGSKLETEESKGPQNDLALWVGITDTDAQQERRTHGIGSYAVLPIPVSHSTHGP